MDRFSNIDNPLFEEIGRIHPDFNWPLNSPEIVREVKSVFDLIEAKYPKRTIVDMRVTPDGRVMLRSF